MDKEDLKKLYVILLLLMMTVSCQSWFKSRNAPLIGTWLQTKLTPSCQNLMENRVKFKEMICGSWNNINFYLESFFHVQALNFKDSDTGKFLFQGAGEMAGGACFLGISAYVTGGSISILSDKKQESAKAIIFEIGAIGVESNKDVKGFCTLKYDTLSGKWCGVGVERDLELAKKTVEKNPDC